VARQENFQPFLKKAGKVPFIHSGTICRQFTPFIAFDAQNQHLITDIALSTETIN